MIVLLLALNIILSAYLVLSVKPMKAPVPVRFTSFTNFDQLGSWQTLYYISGTSWLLSVANVYLAHTVYRRSRIASVMIILTSVVLVILALQLAIFFVGVSYGTR